jgi:hypothetical protein
MHFDTIEKRLRYMGHIFNLITEAYLFGQDTKSFDKEFKKAGPGKRRKLWIQRGKLGKLYNLVTHVIASEKRTELFISFQEELNLGITKRKK